MLWNDAKDIVVGGSWQQDFKLLVGWIRIWNTTTFDVALLTSYVKEIIEILLLISCTNWKKKKNEYLKYNIYFPTLLCLFWFIYLFLCLFFSFSHPPLYISSLSLSLSLEFGSGGGVWGEEDEEEGKSEWEWMEMELKSTISLDSRFIWRTTFGGEFGWGGTFYKI